jgi:hypothetical protein
LVESKFIDVLLPFFLAFGMKKEKENIYSPYVPVITRISVLIRQASMT